MSQLVLSRSYVLIVQKETHNGNGHYCDDVSAPRLTCQVRLLAVDSLARCMTKTRARKGAVAVGAFSWGPRFGVLGITGPGLSGKL